MLKNSRDRFTVCKLFPQHFPELSHMVLYARQMIPIVPVDWARNVENSDSLF